MPSTAWRIVHEPFGSVLFEASHPQPDGRARHVETRRYLFIGHAIERQKNDAAALDDALWRSWRTHPAFQPSASG